MAQEDNALDVRALTVRYGHLTAACDVSLRAVPGEVELVLGANGAGKSSTLRAIAGSVSPASGSVTVAGKDVTGRPAWRVVQSGVVLVPEGRRIVASLSVEENLRLGGYANRSASNRESTMRRVYELFPVLGDRRKSAGGLLSGGEQQMLAFGRALMANPSVMLLDEPSMGLAPAMVDRVFDTVADIAARGVAVVMVEQNAAAMDIAAHVSVLEQGRVTLSGASETLRQDGGITEAFLGVAGTG